MRYKPDLDLHMRYKPDFDLDMEYKPDLDLHNTSVNKRLNGYNIIIYELNSCVETMVHGQRDFKICSQ